MPSRHVTNSLRIEIYTVYSNIKLSTTLKNNQHKRWGSKVFTPWPRHNNESVQNVEYRVFVSKKHDTAT